MKEIEMGIFKDMITGEHQQRRSDGSYGRSVCGACDSRPCVCRSSKQDRQERGGRRR